MNFFEAQEKARRDTWQLVILFLLAVGGLVLVSTLFVSWFYVTFITYDSVPFTLQRYLSSPITHGTSLVILLIVGMGTLYQYLSLAKGGKNVAETLGGRQLNPNTATAEERRLLNVVEEMAIASGIPTPMIYLLEDKSINAFAAGLTIDDAVIGITRGAVEKLERDELQGVIAHEFSHIFNSDMRLNMHLAATLHGIVLIGLIGEFIMRHLGRNGGTNGRKSGGNNLIILGLGLYVIGYVGLFLGALIKAAVSRRREYLADATAVQYTRFPAGIAGALKKILYYQSYLGSPSASTFAHFYFSQGVRSFFSTHPPLKARIYKIDPKWNGKIPEYEEETKRTVPSDKAENKEKQNIFVTGAVAAAVLKAGTLEEDEVASVHTELESLEGEIREKLNEPLGAQAAILMLFYQKRYRERLFALVKSHNPYLLLELANFLSKDMVKHKENTLLIVPLALYTLKNLSLEQYRNFDTLMQEFADIDAKISMYEWSLVYIIRRNLQMHFGERKVPKRLKYTHLGAVKGELEVLFSMLMQDQYANDEEAKRAFEQVMKTIGAGALQYRSREGISHEMFDNAIKEIELVKPGVAERIFEGVIHSVKSDGSVSPNEQLFIHALAQLIQVPLPSAFKLPSAKR
ncbi:MAG: M48 family metallopeptidase [Sulfurovum sp.]|nr:M48 family metallopeptidase [Sulfurovum sp.]